MRINQSSIEVKNPVAGHRIYEYQQVRLNIRIFLKLELLHRTCKVEPSTEAKVKFAGWVWIPLLIMSHLAPPVFAKEGFSTSLDSAPAAVKAVWNRIYA